MDPNDKLAISINGEPQRIARGSTVAAMLGAIGLDPTKVAVERNCEIVPRSMLGEVAVVDGDAFEIVHFVGGG
jgi:thiamine biosynthesis protein ThiS